MRVLVADEVPLWGITHQTTDYYGDGKTVVHGPWQAADCRQVLLRWFDNGFIECVAISWGTQVGSGDVVHCEYDGDWRSRATESGQHLTLAQSDARALLSDPSTWEIDGVGSGVMLCASDSAYRLPFDGWFVELAGLPEQLIYEKQ
jgi:hypothetical protein